jgi:hypothetical protein
LKLPILPPDYSWDVAISTAFREPGAAPVESPANRQLLVDQNWPKTRWVEFVLISTTDSHILPILHIEPIVESVTYVFSMPLKVGAPGLAFETWDYTYPYATT